MLADFDGDGLQDMALVQLDGSVEVLLQTPLDEAALTVRVTLAPGGPTAGPVVVCAANDCWPLGAWAVSPGTSQAVFARLDAGEVTVTWQLPGGQMRQKILTLEQRRVRLIIGERRAPRGLPAGAEAAVRKLTGELGSDDFKTREEASRRLVAMGEAIRAHVKSAARSSDPEVRQRAENILEVFSAREAEVSVF